ncbi:MAG TPA: pitrilysin family protein [Longimicrobiales bacterium]|nr:pitrilysin family protein [Longimicrobiales bacterium]
MRYPARRILTLLPTLLLLAACASSAPRPAAEAAPDAPAQARAATPATPPTAAQQPRLVRGASVEGITEYTLDNGLRVLLFPDASSPTTTVNITYQVGSRHEAYGETGMAHLLEHLVFKGTPRHPNIPQELTERGASPNGTTWFDRTNYYETFTATADNLEWALDLEADRMVNSFISGDDLASEMTVVRNEFESGENSPFRVLLERTLSTMYLWHNYGNSTIGARADLENVPIERLQAFYRKYYQPDNAILVVSGRFDDARARDLIVEKFGAIPRPERTGTMRIWPTYTLDPVQDGERSVTLRRVGDTQMAGVGYHVAPGSHEDWAALDLLRLILTDQPSGRLYRALVEPRKAAFVNTVAFQLREPSPFMAFAEVRREDSLDEAHAIMLRVFDELRTDRITDAEVARAKAARMRQFQVSFNSSQGIALNLSEWAGTGDWRLLFIHRDRVEQVTADDVNEVVRRYFVPANRTIAQFLPTDAPIRAEIPAAPDVAALVADYRGREAIAAGEEFDPSPANIDARTQRFTLANGIEVGLLPKSTRGDAVQAGLTLRFGTEEMLLGKTAIGSITGAMLMRGSTSMTRAEIREAFDALGTQANVSGSSSRAFVQLTTTRAKLAESLRLGLDILMNPAFPESEFEQIRTERLAALEAQRSEPQAIAARTLGRHGQPWPKGHPNYTPTLDEEIEDIKAVTLADVTDYYRRMYGASSGTFTIIGPFDTDEVRSILEQQLATMPAKVQFARVANPFHELPPANIDIETPDKANAIFFAALPLRISDTHADYPAMVMANFMLGGGFLNSRLATRIRQQEGLSYGVGSAFNADPVDESGMLQVFAIYAPQNRAALEAAFEEEIRRLLADGFTAEELDAARNGWLQQATVQRSNDSYLRVTINNNIFYGRTMQHYAELEDRIRALTVEQVNAAVRRHIDLAKMVRVKAGDFKAIRM